METHVEAAPPPVSNSSERTAIIRLLVVGALLLVAFWPILASMYGSWFDDRAYMEHGIFVIPAAAYMVWTKRAKLRTMQPKPSLWGIAILVGGALAALLGTAAHWTWVSRTAFVVAIFGWIALTYGFRMIRELIYPLCTLLLMIAPPTFVFERLTLGLQLLASRIAEASLDTFGISVLREGNVLELVGIKLSVEEACSGIRSLMAILFMCAIYNFFFVERPWMRTLIVLMAVPIAILGNAGRIVFTGIASQFDKSLVSGTAHETLGYITVVLAALGCMGTHIIISYCQKIWRTHHGQ